MAISKYGNKLLQWLERYKITADELLARIPISRQRGTIIKAALTELAPLELPAPATFTMDTLKDTTVVLNWASVTDATGYIVQRATNKGFTSNKTDVYTGNLLTFTDTGLTPSKNYYYRVFATSTDPDVTDVEPNNYTKLTVSTLDIIAAPATLVASGITDAQAVLTWAAVSGATGYVLSRATTADFASPTTVYTGALLTYTNTGLSQTTRYYYRVTATDATHTTPNYKKTDFTTLATTP